MCLRDGAGIGGMAPLIHIANFLGINVNGYLTISPTDEEEIFPQELVVTLGCSIAKHKHR